VFREQTSVYFYLERNIRNDFVIVLYTNTPLYKTFSLTIIKWCYVCVVHYRCIYAVFFPRAFSSSSFGDPREFPPVRRTRARVRENGNHHQRVVVVVHPYGTRDAKHENAYTVIIRPHVFRAVALSSSVKLSRESYISQLD